MSLYIAVMLLYVLLLIPTILILNEAHHDKKEAEKELQMSKELFNASMRNLIHTGKTHKRAQETLDRAHKLQEEWRGLVDIFAKLNEVETEGLEDQQTMNSKSRPIRTPVIPLHPEPGPSGE